MLALSPLFAYAAPSWDLTAACVGDSLVYTGNSHGDGTSHYFDVYQGTPGSATLINGSLGGTSDNYSQVSTCGSINFLLPWFAVFYKATDLSAMRSYFQSGGSEPNTNYGLYQYGTAISDTHTRIIVTDPYNNETIATSTGASLGAQGYINEDDYRSGTFLEIKFATFSSYQSSVASPDSLFTTIDIPINAAGSFNVSTTTSILSIGQYKMTTAIKTPSITNNILNFFGFGQFATFGLLTSTSTVFTAAHLSGYDAYVASTTGLIDDYLASSTISLSACTSWTQFSLGDCLNLMFVPQTQPISNALLSFKDNFLSYFPWGYLTRFVVILSGSATTSLPTISTTIPVSPTEDMHILDLDLQDMVDGGGESLNSIRDPYSNSNIQDIAQPIWRLILGLAIVMLIIKDISRMSHSREASNLS